jgi:hypothetical protein
MHMHKRVDNTHTHIHMHIHVHIHIHIHIHFERHAVSAGFRQLKTTETAQRVRAPMQTYIAGTNVKWA